jgi:putative sigma-54 modulation protein
MDATDAIKDYVEKKVSKLTKYYDRVQMIEVVLDMEADKPSVEIVASARKSTFVASHREDDMYACIDHCLDKITEQLRRHKDRVRDHQGPSRAETGGGGFGL